jgi:hypothetical protein
MFSDIKNEYSEMHSNQKRYSIVGGTRKKQREMKNVKKSLVGGTNPHANINQPVSDKVDRDFDFALSSIYDGDSSFAEYGGAVASGFAKYATEQFPVDDCQQTLHMSTSNKMAIVVCQSWRGKRES